MIREKNVEKRLQWALEHNGKEEIFQRLIFTDETTVQFEHHRRRCCYKRGLKPHYKPKPKHPIKLHVRYTSQVIFAFAHERAILSPVILRDSELLSRERARRSRIIVRYLSCKLTNLTYVRTCVFTRL